MYENIAIIAINDIDPIIETAGDSVEEKLRSAMMAMKCHWLVTEESDRFSVAITAVELWLERNDRQEDLSRVEWEIESGIALLSGNIVRMEELGMEKYQPIGIIKMWRQIHDE